MGYIKSKNTIEFRVNEYLTLKLEGGRTFIYVRGKRFRQCVRLVLHIPVIEVAEYDQIDSIDEAFELYRRLDSDRFHDEEYSLDVTPEQEFWGHCSNIQAWVEHNYDPRLLHSNLAFPLLKALAREGLSQARKLLKFEIMKRFERGSLNVLLMLTEQKYIFYLDGESIRQKIEDLVVSRVKDDRRACLLILRLRSHLKKLMRKERLAKLREEDGLSGWCPECGGRPVLIRERGEIVCAECGLVLNEKLATGSGMNEEFSDYFLTVLT